MRLLRFINGQERIEIQYLFVISIDATPMLYKALKDTKLKNMEIVPKMLLKSLLSKNYPIMLRAENKNANENYANMYYKNFRKP